MMRGRGVEANDEGRVTEEGFLEGRDRGGQESTKR